MEFSAYALSGLLSSVKEVVLDAAPFINAQGYLRGQLEWMLGYLRAGAKLTLFCPPRYDPRLKREVAAVRWLEELAGAREP